jgi:fused signal recognition particle receptor
MNFLSKIKQGLSKTSTKITTELKNIFYRKKIDHDTLEQLEELLISCDIGIETTTYIINELTKKFFDKELELDVLKQELSQVIEEMITKVPLPQEVAQKRIILICGVNGNGKTTSIAKLAHKYMNEGKKTLLVACDTFRAAAVEQLEHWADKINCKMLKGEPNADPASVAFKAIEEFKNSEYDILLIDTAGRLQNNQALMEELAKISRVAAKASGDIAIEAYMILDATTGQNGIMQLEKFNEAVKITSLIVTKLDGTAKAGIVIALINKFKIPVIAIGVGEKIDDLKPFNSKDFADSLLGL